jgi:acetylornithine deacetylase
MRQKLADLVDSLRDETVRTCQDLVRINTMNPYSGDPHSAGEKAGQEYLAPILEGLGAQVTLFEPTPDIYDRCGVLGPKNRVFTDRPNLVAEFGFGPGPRIVLNAHMDTVGAQDMEFDPFAAEVRDGKIWGRGTSDCKGGQTVGVMALKALLALGVELHGSVCFQSVVDEECNGGGAGTLACIEAGHTHGDLAIFLDGNELTFTLGCGGCLTADVFVQGRSGHAARGGVSAIEKALSIKQAVDAFKREREARYPNALLNLGIFRSGVHPAVVPADAYLSLNIVYDLEEARAAEAEGRGWNGSAIREEFEQRLAEADRGDEWLAGHPTRVEWVKDLIPFAVPPADPAIQDFTATFRAVRQEEPVFNRMDAWSDSCYPARLANMPAVLFGPGTAGCAHASVEYVEIEKLVAATKVVAAHLAAKLGAH